MPDTITPLLKIRYGFSGTVNDSKNEVSWNTVTENQGRCDADNNKLCNNNELCNSLNKKSLLGEKSEKNQDKEAGYGAPKRPAPPKAAATFDDRKKAFANQLALYVKSEDFPHGYPREMLRAFYIYWGEANKIRTQMRWEQQKTWELRARLATWASREEVKKGTPNPEDTYTQPKPGINHQNN